MVFKIEYLDGTYETIGSPAVDYNLYIALMTMPEDKINKIVRVWRVK